MEKETNTVPTTTEPLRDTIKKRTQAILCLCDIYCEAIESATKHGIHGGLPSGHLYAKVMEFGLSLETHQFVIQVLKDARKITEVNHLLTSV